MLMNAEQAARELGRNPRLLRYWAKAGKVQGMFKVGVSWVAEFDAWKAAANEVRKPGRKPNRLSPD